MPRRNPPRSTETLTTTEVAKILGYDPRTVRRHGHSIGYRIGNQWRFPKSVIDALLQVRDETEAAS